MFQRIDQYDLLNADGRWYRPRAYGNPQPDGTWDGWLVFFPLDGGPAIASNRETTQSSSEALILWAAGLTPVYVQGALARAIRIAERPPILAHLATEEYQALEESIELESAAELERTAARADEAAAAAARSDAERIHEERLVTEKALAASAPDAQGPRRKSARSSRANKTRSRKK